MSARPGRLTALLSVAGLGVAMGAGSAAAETVALQPTPSVRIVSGALISPSAAEAWYAGRPQGTTDGLCQAYPNLAAPCPNGVRVRAPELKSLARALRNDPDLIYEYVRNRIDTEFLFGMHKGALGTFIDGSGTAFDQAQLLTELLREAGYSTHYSYGTLTLSGAQFEAWTGLKYGKAVCDFLATSGIPATVSTCDGASVVSSVSLSHVWVEAAIGGSTVFFDPAYKPSRHRAGIDVRQGMGFASGAAASAAGGAEASTGTVGVTVLGALNAPALNTTLAGYSGALTARLRQEDMQGARLADVVGGREILAAARPAGGWRQARPGNYVSSQTWSAVPDRYRVKLTLQAGDPATSSVYVDAAFFGDEIYGRRLQLGSRVVTGEATPFWRSFLNLDGDDLALGAGQASPAPYDLHLSIGADHPFAAADGTYGDAVVKKAFNPIDPATLLVAWGATSPALLAKWESEQAFDTPGAITAYMPLSENGNIATGSGDLLRARLAATWMAQFSQAAELHARVSGGRAILLHSLGIVSSQQSTVRMPSLPWAPDQETGATPTGFNTYDEVAVLDIESSFGLVNRTSDASARRGALHAIAATAAALEGSVIAQIADSPDVSSTATRLAWGNAPEIGETLNAGGRNVFRYANATAAALALTNTVYEGGTGATAVDGEVPAADLPTVTAARQRQADAVAAYATQGFEVVASSEAFLGPGHRVGSEYPEYSYTIRRHQFGDTMSAWSGCVAGRRSAPIVVPRFPIEDAAQPGGWMEGSNEFDWYDCWAGNSPGYWSYEGPASVGAGDTVTRTLQKYSRLPTLERGGALIATKYDPANPDDPIEIAHVITRNGRPTKGGGGPSATQVSAYNPSEPAQSIKDRFVDRSGALGVDLSSGQAGFVSPVLASVGPGEFPYRLERRVELRGGTVKSIPPYVVEAGVPGWGGPAMGDMGDGPVSNWRITADVSNSGFEAMGQTRAEAAASTIAAFAVMQDLWANQPKGSQRDIAGVLVAKWWTDQLLFNVVSVKSGGATSQFVKLADGTFAPAHGGGERVILSGNRQLVRPDFEQLVRARGAHQKEATLRAWRYNGVSLQLVGGNGDVRSFGYIGAGAPMPGATGVTVDRFKAWRLNAWTFSNGLKLTLNYGATPSIHAQSVQSNLGMTLTLPAPGAGYYDAATDLAAPCGVAISTATTLGNTTKLQLRAPLARSATQRPDPVCRPLAVFAPHDLLTPSLSYVYDGLGRVAEARDGVAIREPAARGPYLFFVADGYRGEQQDPTGARYAVETLEGGRLTRTIDELGRVTTGALDGRGRVLSRTYPEGDQDLFAYDLRDNMLSLTKKAKPGSELADVVSTVSYGEGALVWTCANARTCNRPVSSDGPRTDVVDVTTYSWNATTGSLVQVLKPADGSGIRPQTDYDYTVLGGVLLMTSRTEKIEGAISTTTTFEYDAGAQYRLKASTVDSGGLNLRTCYQYDPVGNITGVSDPRTAACPATVQ